MSNIYNFGNTAYLGESSAIVTVSDTSELITIDKKISPISVSSGKKDIEIIPWGSSNDLPMQVMSKIYALEQTASNIDFNNRMAYGDGIMPVKREIVNNKPVYTPVFDNTEINEFFENNNIQRYLLEAASDLNAFYNGWSELVLSPEKKVVQLVHREASFTRLCKANEKTKKIEQIACSAYWSEPSKVSEDLLLIDLLDDRSPLLDLKIRLGLAPGVDGKTQDNGVRNFAVSLSLPTPSKFYYQKPYWWAIFESGWRDLACAIPAFKKALLNNGMKIRYHVQFNNNFWDKQFKAAKKTTEEEQIKLKNDFLTQLDKFLAGTENAGKSFLSEISYTIDGKVFEDVIIKPIESKMDGGEYLDDSEEASNIICYAMGVHPSLIGASPGKNKSINGTEARELFIIKQALMKPIRDSILLPLNIIKRINGWPDDVFFTIPNIELTTLDQGTGSKKVIS